MTSLEKNLRFSIGQYIGKTSWLYWINYHRSIYKDILVYDDTDLCIEGFQRSGNSFFQQLMRRQNRDLKLAHHMHVPLQVIRAVDHKIPTVILIRKPQDSIASLLAWDQNLRIDVALAAYHRFYHTILPYRDQYVIGRFEEVTDNPKSIVTKINAHFDTQFVMHVKDDKQLANILSRVSERTKNTLSAPVPNEKKERIKQQYKESILDHPKYPRAQEIYKSFIATV